MDPTVSASVAFPCQDIFFSRVRTIGLCHRSVPSLISPKLKSVWVSQPQPTGNIAKTASTRPRSSLFEVLQPDNERHVSHNFASGTVVVLNDQVTHAHRLLDAVDRTSSGHCAAAWQYKFEPQTRTASLASATRRQIATWACCKPVPFHQGEAPTPCWAHADTDPTTHSRQSFAHPRSSPVLSAVTKCTATS